MTWDRTRAAAGMGIAPPLGARVRLASEGRTGRVTTWIAGGLACRVRLDQPDGAVVERPCCDLLPCVDEEGTRPAAPEPGGSAAGCLVGHWAAGLRRRTVA